MLMFNTAALYTMYIDFQNPAYAARKTQVAVTNDAIYGLNFVSCGYHYELSISEDLVVEDIFVRERHSI